MLPEPVSQAERRLEQSAVLLALVGDRSARDRPAGRYAALAHAL